MSPIPPGATIGFLGGGQLGRMAGIAARELGYRVRVLDPDPHCAAGPVADAQHIAGFDDVNAARALARSSAVVSYEIEGVSAAVLQAVGAEAALRPGAHVLSIVQDREIQKRWLGERGFPIGPWAVASDAAALAEVASTIGAPVRLKAARDGYDGRSQAKCSAGEDLTALWHAMGQKRCVVERELDLAAECSVLVARRPLGVQVVVHPVARNWHLESILDISLFPSGLPSSVERKAEEIARSLADELNVEGLLVVEFFVTRDGSVLVNELAPRPHNSFHHAEAACGVGQFEQYIRAICDLPLAEVSLTRSAALANLLGDLWQDGRPPAFERALAVPGIQLHLYGKTHRPGRKLGHLVSHGATSAEALERLNAARDALAQRSTQAAR